MLYYRTNREMLYLFYQKKGREMLYYRTDVAM